MLAVSRRIRCFFKRLRRVRSGSWRPCAGLTVCGKTHAAQFSRWGLGRRSIPPQQPVMKPTRRSAGDPSRPRQPAVKPTRRSAGDPSRLNHSASLRSALRFGRNTRGIPPSRALSAGRLAGLGAHVGSTTGCSPRRCAPLIVAFRSKYTRYSSLTRLVSRTPTGRTGPRRSRRSREFHHRLLTPGSERCAGDLSQALDTEENARLRRFEPEWFFQARKPHTVQFPALTSRLCSTSGDGCAGGDSHQPRGGFR